MSASRGRMPRSAGIGDIRRTLALDAEATRRGMPLEELHGSLGQRPRERSAVGAPTPTRRELLAGAGAVLLGSALSASPALAHAARRKGAPRPRIAIVGGGLAGLRCAHFLASHGRGRDAAVTVYEANPERAGGRCWTLRGYFANGATTEHGGAFIDTRHHAMRRLVARLGLQLEVVDGGDEPTGEDLYWIDGGHYSRAEASADWTAVGYRAFHTAAAEIGEHGGEQRLDAMSVSEWLESTEIGTGSRLGRLLLANAVTENGADPELLSALDLIEVTAPSKRSQLELLPGDDEHYHVVGGSDRIVSGMLAQLPAETVKHGHQLVALRELGDGTFTLSFEVAGQTVQQAADMVVLALPFSTLRNVELSKSGLSTVKRHVIETFGMGTNAKVHVELSHKTWPALGFSGAAYGEWDGFCCAWDDSVGLGPNASPALLCGYPGGHRGASGLSGQAHGPAPATDAEWFLGAIEPGFPGTSAAYTGRSYEDHWALDPWVGGAYSYLGVGQASTYGELSAAREGRIHFAGEHTSIEHQGFMQGAVETGERAAHELLARL